MIPLVHKYSDMPVEAQVKLQITLIRHYADDWRDMPSFTIEDMREAITVTMKDDLAVLIDEEKYELCAIYRDAIENIKYVSLKQIL